MWKLVGLLILTSWSRRWSQKIFFLAPPSGQNRKLKFPNAWILDKPEVTKWPEMKPEAFYRPNLSRNFLEWVTKTIMSHIIWLMIMVEFCLWPINLWIGFPSSGSRYSKTDFRIVFLMSSFIPESYWLFAEVVDHMIASGWSEIVPETHVCKKWVDMDTKMTLIVFWVLSRPYLVLVGLFSWFPMIFRFSKFFYGASWVLKWAVWASCADLCRKWPI